MSLRLKLLLAASLLLSVPLVGYRYVVAMEEFLREHQTQAAMDSARTLALALAGESKLLARPTPSSAETLFVHPIAQSLQIDGYDEDWSSFAITPHPSAVNLRAASDGQAMFILLKLPAGAHTQGASRLRLILDDAPTFKRAWFLDATVPGLLAVREVPPAGGLTQPAHPDTRIRAASQRHGDELLYEIRIPLSIGIVALSFEVLTVQPAGHENSETDKNVDALDEANYAENSRIEAVQTRIPRGGVFQVRFAPQELAALLHAWAPAPGRRLRVVDVEGRVIAQAGDVARSARQSPIHSALDLFVETHDERRLTLAPVTLKLSGPEVDSALAGVAAVRIRRLESDGPLVVSAAYPLHNGDALLGALILEESTSPAQALARHALLELILGAAGAFVIGAAVLIVVSGRVVARLRLLRDQAAAAVDDSGRVLKSFNVSTDIDEIGDLGRSFGAAVSRLQGYQQYLEKLAQRLSHELRTPLAVIRSSLDNLSMTGTAPQHDVYIGRAQYGVERLDSIVRRMSEAARLEQAMADTERGPFDLTQVVNAVFPAYQQSWSEWPLELHAPSIPCFVDGSAELIVQALDKLLSNARDFADLGTAIIIRLSLSAASTPQRVQLEVCNTGARLPSGATSQLFESMNSQRTGSDQKSTEAHLGFGLYVVRLVAEFHGGEAFAHDNPATRTVSIGMQLPCCPRSRPRS
ncbi:MAG: two-component system sensor histidine kinase ChvG [Gammaproteobacteria bacterium]|jgi:two-component system sensor histidine kinase ChvG